MFLIEHGEAPAFYAANKIVTHDDAMAVAHLAQVLAVLVVALVASDATGADYGVYQ